MAYLAESLMSISDISIGCSFKKLVMELESLPATSGTLPIDLMHCDCLGGIMTAVFYSNLSSKSHSVV